MPGFRGHHPDLPSSAPGVGRNPSAALIRLIAATVSATLLGLMKTKPQGLAEIVVREAVFRSAVNCQTPTIGHRNGLRRSSPAPKAPACTPQPGYRPLSAA